MLRRQEATCQNGLSCFPWAQSSRSSRTEPPETVPTKPTDGRREVAVRHVPDTTVPDETMNPLECPEEVPPRRDGRVVDGGGLENVDDRLYQDGYIFPPNFI